jgi:hypothetical protein
MVVISDVAASQEKRPAAPVFQKPVTPAGLQEVMVLWFRTIGQALQSPNDDVACRYGHSQIPDDFAFGQFNDRERVRRCAAQRRSDIFF